MLYGIIGAAWIALYAMSIPPDLREASRLFGAEFLAALCTVTPDIAGLGRVTLMWLVMATAMMLPTALPAFAAYDDIRRAGAKTNLTALVGGFLTVWAGFSLVAAALQMALFRLDLVSPYGDSRSIWLSAALLALAGGYQFSAIKESCLRACRSPMAFFMQDWDRGAWRNGLHLGAMCIGCCWALMLLAFVGGVLSLAFMCLATVIMTLEKLPDIGRWLSLPLGVALLAGSAAVSISAAI